MKSLFGNAHSKCNKRRQIKPIPTFNLDAGGAGCFSIEVYSLAGVDSNITATNAVNVQGHYAKLMGGLDARS